MNNKLFLTICIFFFVIFIIFPQEILAYNDISLQLKVLDLTEAGPPEIYNDYLIFSYQVDIPIRYIGIRFEHEDYKDLYVYSRNENDVYYLIYLIPAERATLKYRMVIDGLWIIDKYNEISVKDELTGIEFSIVDFGESFEKKIENPIMGNEPLISFAYKGDPGRSIFIIGDFNNWDPYMYKLDEISPGYYFISLNIGPGRHYYNFVINGEKVADPNNYNNVYDRESNLMSFFDIKY